MSKIISISKRTAALPKLAFLFVQVILGSIFLALISQVAIPLPFTPVPISLQTLGVSILALSLGSRKGLLAVFCYLLQASAGLPVLAAGTANPLWMVSPRVGYLLGFILSVYITGRLFESFRINTFLKSFLAISVGEFSTILLGTACLSIFVGFENGISMGLLPFIPGALCKIGIAAASVKPIRFFKSLF